MNSRHLATGDESPPLIPGSLRIYSMRFCPYAQRALLAAAAKGIKYDVVNVNLITKPEFIFSKNPDGKVPTVESDDGHILYESLIVSDYIDEAEEFNKQNLSGGDSAIRKLTPTDPFSKAVDRIWIEKFNKIISLDSKLYLGGLLNNDQIKTLIKALNDELLVLEHELERRGTGFFGDSEKPGMLDYMIWPWMERLPCLPIIYADEASLFQEGRTACPNLTRWEQAMIQDYAVKESYLSPEIHSQYRSMRRAGGTVNYDFLHHMHKL